MAPPDPVASGREQRVAEIQAIMEGLSQPPQSSLPPAHVLSSGKTEVYNYIMYYGPEESLGVVAISWIKSLKMSLNQAHLTGHVTLG